MMNTRENGPIFVVGAPRTGTTLTMEILNRHSKIHLFNEVHYHERIVDVVGGTPILGEEALDQSIDILFDHCKRYLDSSVSAVEKESLRKRLMEGDLTHSRIFELFLQMEAESFGKTIWGDSSPQDVLYMEALKKWYPDARFIGVVRDPRAYLASYKNYYKKKISSYRNRFNPISNSILWKSYMNALRKASSGNLQESLMLVHYEDLVSNPEETVRGLVEFLGLDYQDEMLQVGRQNSSYFSVAEDKKQSGISSGSIARWRTELTNVDLWVLNKVCGSTMESLGYSVEEVSLGIGDTKDFIAVGAKLPARLFNNLFRTGKPFTKEKLSKVFKSLR